VAIIVVVTYVVAVMHFAHVIVGTIETSYAAFAGTTSWWRAMGVHLPASLIGNIIGGVSLTAAVNHAQVVAGGVSED
jgi:formate/nitrite transporter FocA (FNT family)